MITMSHIFGSDSLFQAGSELSLTGICSENADISLTIFAPSGNVYLKTASTSDSHGAFSVSFRTPEASFGEYKLILRCGEEERVMERVMFGEVWLATGQSNMELTNGFITHHDRFIDSVKEKKIRVWNAFYPEKWGAHEFPFTPDTLSPGEWICADEHEKLCGVSAAGLKFASDIYDRLNENADVPVGLLNCSWGATGIFAWIPRDYAEANERVLSVLKRLGLYISEDEWNKKGDGNFAQMSAQFNFKIAPLLGTKFRGFIWYQGENECGGEFSNRIYSEYMRVLRQAYEDLFAADKSCFMMISSLLYPWIYSGGGDCHLGYLNSGIADACIREPDKFAAISIGDLEPVWCYHAGNHPIHPTNKYEVGARLASLALTNVYRYCGQKSPAHLTSFEKIDEGRKLRLHFASVGSGLKVGSGDENSSLRCLYVSGGDGIYLPAEYEIISDRVIDVWSDEISVIENACFAFQSLDIKCNLFAGDYPVFPFATDMVNEIHLEQHRFYDTSDNIVLSHKCHDPVWDLFYHPMWKGYGETDVCVDKAFRHSAEASIRVSADEKKFGCYTRSYPYNRLDLGGFSFLEVSFYGMKETACKLILESDESRTETEFIKLRDISDGWERYRAALDKIPAGEIKRMGFEFSDGKNDYHFVNFERIRLIK